MNKIMIILSFLLLSSCGDTFKINKASVGGGSQNLGQEVNYNPQPISTDNLTKLNSICSALEYKMLYLLTPFAGDTFNYIVRARECQQIELSGTVTKQISDNDYAYTRMGGTLSVPVYSQMNVMELPKNGTGNIAIFCEHPSQTMINTSANSFNKIEFPGCTATNALCYSITKATKAADGKFYATMIEQVAVSTLANTKGYVKERRVDGQCTDSPGIYYSNEKLLNIQDVNGSTIQL